MKTDRLKWNEKYKGLDADRPPSEIVTAYAKDAPKGRALVLACGTGRNAIYLSQNGFAVDAVDISDVAIGKLRQARPSINAFTADLDDWEIQENRYTLIVNVRFLHRRLFPWIKEGLIPGGMLIFETFLESKADDPSQMPRRDYLLRENELLHAFLGLRIRYYEERPNEPDDESRRHGPVRVASLVGVKPE